MKKIKKKLFKVLDRCLSLLYPRTCCFCGKVSVTEICDDCREKAIYIEEPRCKKCGKPVRYEEQEYCYDCQKKTFYFEQGKNLWLHTGCVRFSIYQFKYHNRRIYGEFYAKEMFRLYSRQIREWGIDVIIPVPLHARRLRTRGYNQAEIVARKLGELCQIPVDTKSVVRKRETQPQKELSHRERKKNLRDVFEVKKGWVQPKRILLIDDIYTTGSTIDALSKVLCENGESKVWFLTISIGQGF